MFGVLCWSTIVRWDPPPDTPLPPSLPTAGIDVKPLVAIGGDALGKYLTGCLGSNSSTSNENKTRSLFRVEAAWPFMLELGGDDNDKNNTTPTAAAL